MAESDLVTLVIGSPTKISIKSPVKESNVASTANLDVIDLAKPLEKKVIQKITIDSDSSRAAKRLERFGLPEKEEVAAKKTKRTQRFSDGHVTASPTAAGNRGGTGTNGAKAVISSTPEIEEKKKARAERFGKATVVSAEGDDKKKARSARFGGSAK